MFLPYMGFYTYFNIEDRDQSVHFPVYCQFKFPHENRGIHTGDKSNTNPTHKHTNRLRWNEGLKDNFLRLFREKLARSRQNISLQINQNVDVAINLITDIYTSSAKCMPKSTKTKGLPSQPPWWNVTCNDLKQQKYSALRRFRKSNITSDFRQYKDARNLFKHTCRLKKQQYQKSCRKKLMEASNDPKKFWKTVKVSQTPSNPGPDLLSAEFFKNTCSEIEPILKDLFNYILDTGDSPQSFGETVLCPIHKSGSTQDPNNFRGIALINAMYKIFSIILNKRLYSWAEENEKLDEAQAGFRAGYSAVDNIFSLSAVCQKYLSKRGGGRFYCLYVDFQKAFDKVEHEQLFKSLMKKGIHGKFLRTVKSMYSNLQATVRTAKMAF